MKKLLIYTALFVSIAANSIAAEFNFTDYESTLTKKHKENISNIKSAYTMQFTPGTSSDYSFVYYKLNSDNTTTKVYYKTLQDMNSEANGINLAKITTGNSGLPVEGYLINKSDTGTGGAITLTSGMLGDVKADFIGNNVPGYAGAVFVQSANIASITGDFIGNYVIGNRYIKGGAVSLWRTTTGAFNSSFINNYIETSSNTTLAVGGAISTDANMLFTAHNKNNIFTENYTIDKNGKVYNSIYVHTASNKSPTITFDVANNNSIIINDNIAGGYLINSMTTHINTILFSAVMVQEA